MEAEQATSEKQSPEQLAALLAEREAMSIEQLEALLAKKKEDEAKKKLKEKHSYEQRRNGICVKHVRRAQELNGILTEFKKTVFEELITFKDEMLKYGDISKQSKGGFSIVSEDESFKIVYGRKLEGDFDERATLGVENIKNFLDDTVKKRDQKMYKMLMKLISLRGSEEMNTNRVFELISLKNEYNDPRWLKGVELLEESYKNRAAGFFVSFFIQNQQGKYDSISLTFPSLPI